MASSQWHKFYASKIAAAPELLFELLSDLPNYGRWLPASGQFGRTTDVEPYPVQLGSRYHDGKPGEPGKDWWGTVTGFQPVGFKYSAMGPDLRQGERPSGRLCGRFVLADQAAEDLVAPDPVEWDRERDHMPIVAGCSKVKRAVGPSAVVVGGVLLQYDAQMSLAGDEHPVGAFGPGGENPALREGVRSRALRGDLEWFDAFAGEHGVERVCEFRVAVADEVAELAGAVAEVGNEVSGALGGPDRVSANVLTSPRPRQSWVRPSSANPRRPQSFRPTTA